MECKYCGMQLDDYAVACPNCGNAVAPDNSATQPVEPQADQNAWQAPNAAQDYSYNWQDQNAWQQNAGYQAPPVGSGSSFFADGAWFAAAASFASWAVGLVYELIHSLIVRNISFYSFGYGFLSAVYSLLIFVIPVGICVGLFFAAFSKKYNNNILAELPLAFLPFVCYRGGIAVTAMITNFINGIIHNYTANGIISAIVGFFIQLGVAVAAFFLTKLILKKKNAAKEQENQ